MLDTTASPNSDTLFYDGQCSLCRHEIRLLRATKRDSLRLQDLNQLAPDDDAPPWEELMRSLHLQRADGAWLRGLDASAQAWGHTRWGWLWAPLRWPLIAPVADRVYAYWAQQRLQQRMNCNSCRIKP